MTWENGRKKLNIIEIILLVIIVAVILTGLIGDIRASMGTAKIIVTDYGEISEILVGVQAALLALTIAILALLSGGMKISYLGISVVDYVLNRRPVIFKMKRIIYFSLVILAASVFLHMSGQYNLVVALFVSDCILIFLVVSVIYELFLGHMNLENEIWSDTKSFLEDNDYPRKALRRTNDSKIKKRVEILNNFTEDWKRKIVQQDNVDYENSLNYYKKICEIMILDHAPGIQEELQKSSKILTHTLIVLEEKSEKKNAFQFLYDIYSCIWGSIVENSDRIKQLKDRTVRELHPEPEAMPCERSGEGFRLFHYVCKELMDELDNIPVNVLQKENEIDFFLDKLVRCTIWLATDENCDGQLDDIKWFAGYLGIYLSKQNPADIMESKWTKPISYLDTFRGVIEENRFEYYSKWSAEISLRYALGLINGNMMSVLQEGLYSCAFKNVYGTKSVEMLKMGLAVHCYLFYIAEYESEECVSAELKKSCKDFIHKEEILKSFHYFLRYICRIEKLWTDTLGTDLFKLLRSCESMPKYFQAKTMIMENVVRNYIAFVVMYESEEYHMYELLDKTLSDEWAYLYFMDFLGENRQGKIDRLTDFYGLLLKNENISKYRLEHIFSKFEDAVKNRVKKLEMKKAREDQTEYEKKNVGERMRNSLKEKTLDHLRGKFEPIYVEPIDGGKEVMIRLAMIECFTNSDLERLVAGDYEYMDDHFIDGLYSVLKDMDAFDYKTGDSFTTYEEFVTHVDSLDAELILGSQYALQPDDYRDYPLYNELIDSRECIFAGYENTALFLKRGKLRISITDIDVTVRVGTMDDEKYRYSQTGNIYKYNIINDIPIGFTESELRQFLHDRNKVVEIYARVVVGSLEGKIGEVIEKVPS